MNDTRRQAEDDTASEGKVPRMSGIDETGRGGRSHTERPSFSPALKWTVLAVCSFGYFLDILGVCVFYILTQPIASDLDIAFEQSTWVITSIGITFAAFLLFWGRVSDLHSPKPVFSYGLLSLGLINLGISFTTEKYTFLILRALSGIAASCIVPAAYRIITGIFEKQELARALTCYGMIGGLGASLGVPLGGLLEFITAEGQLSSWRWFFRISTVLSVAFAIWSVIIFPDVRGPEHIVSDKWKRVDLIGSCMNLCGILLLILGLTFGAAKGWSTAGFLAPLVLSMVLILAFGVYERSRPPGYGVLHPVLFKSRNFLMWSIIAMFNLAWYTCNQVPMIDLYIGDRGDLPIIAGLRILPEGLTCCLFSLIVVRYPRITANPRIFYTVGMAMGALGYVLFILSHGSTGAGYWRFSFPAAIVGSAGNTLANSCVIVGAMSAVPAEMGGVAGATLQTFVQAGNAIALAIQAGFLTIKPGGVTDFLNIQLAFSFMVAWGAVCVIGFWVFYRKPPIGLSQNLD